MLEEHGLYASRRRKESSSPLLHEATAGSKSRATESLTSWNKATASYSPRTGRLFWLPTFRCPQRKQRPSMLTAAIAWHSITAVETAFSSALGSCSQADTRKACLKTYPTS